MSTNFSASSDDSAMGSSLSSAVETTLSNVAYGLEATDGTTSSQASLAISPELPNSTDYSLPSSVETEFTQSSMLAPSRILLDQLLLLESSTDFDNRTTAAFDVDELLGLSQPDHASISSGSPSAISSTTIGTLDFRDRFNWNTYRAHLKSLDSYVTIVGDVQSKGE